MGVAMTLALGEDSRGSNMARLARTGVGTEAEEENDDPGRRKQRLASTSAPKSSVKITERFNRNLMPAAIQDKRSPQVLVPASLHFGRWN
jgi:hypothetical protein